MSTSSLVTSSTTLDSTNDVGQYASAAVGADGFPIVAYYDVTNANLMLKHCTNSSCTTADTAVTLDSTGDVGRFASLAIPFDGKPIIAYEDLTNSKLKVVKCNDTSCSSSYVSTSTLSNVTGAVSMVIGRDDLPLIVFDYPTGGGGQQIGVLHCTVADCSQGDAPSAISLAGATKGTATNKVLIRGNGLPVILTHYQNGFEELDLYTCSDTKCSSATKLQIGTQTNCSPTGAFYCMQQDMVIGRDGIPTVVWFDNNNNIPAIKVTRCTDVGCGTAGTTYTLTNPNNGYTNAGAWPSITLGADGYPVVTYLSGGSSMDPVILHCTSNDCNASADGSYITSLDALTTTYATGTQLLKAPDDSMLGFYYEKNGGDLIVARTCENAGCAASSSISGVSFGTPGNYFYRMYAREMYAQQAYLSGFDVAEAYPTSDQSLLPGDIVSLDYNNPGQVVKATSTASAIIGVVSTKPGLYLSDWPINKPLKLVPVALVGRVPVSVTIEKGPIAIGDELTISSNAGVAAKATGPGPIIGRALEVFDGTSSSTPSSTVSVGQISVFIKVGWKSDGTLPTDVRWDKIFTSSTPYTTSTTVSSSVIEDNSDLSFPEQIIKIFINALHKINITIEAGFVSIKNLVVERFTTKELCVGSTCVTEPELKELLQKNNITEPAPAVETPPSAPNINQAPSSTPVTEPTSTPPVDSGGGSSQASSTEPLPTEPVAPPVDQNTTTPTSS